MDTGVYLYRLRVDEKVVKGRETPVKCRRLQEAGCVLGSSDDGIVYSSDHGRMCPKCGRPQADCACAAGRGSRQATGGVRVQRSSKGRKGKTVSVISGLVLDPFALADLARALKQKCGTGGTAKDDTIEIQGDHVDKLVAELRARGFDAKRSGG